MDSRSLNSFSHHTISPLNFGAGAGFIIGILRVAIFNIANAAALVSTAIANIATAGVTCTIDVRHDIIASIVGVAVIAMSFHSSIVLTSHRHHLLRLQAPQRSLASRILKKKGMFCGN
jgi:hypothetical protein